MDKGESRLRMSMDPESRLVCVDVPEAKEDVRCNCTLGWMVVLDKNVVCYPCISMFMWR